MDPTTINPDDTLALIQQVLAAIGAKNWLLAVPLIVLAVIAAFRLWIVPLAPVALAWFKTDRGGALLALVGALATSVIAAAAVPGPHSAAQIIGAAFVFLMGNQALFGWLKKLIAPTGADAVQAVEAKAAAVTASATSPTVAAARINEAMDKLK